MQYFEDSTAVNSAGFDHVSRGMLSLFTAITLNGWNFIMYRTMDTISPWSITYYITLVVVGAYLLVRLQGNQTATSDAINICML